MSSWIYAKAGEPMWEMTEDGLEQSVMFYETDRFGVGLPPMSDADWARLEDASRRRSKLERIQ